MRTFFRYPLSCEFVLILPFQNFVLVRKFQIRKIDIIAWYACGYYYFACDFPEVVSVNTFLNDKINLFCCKLLFSYVDSFFFLCIFISCDEQTFHYSDKVWLILMDATQNCFLFSIRVPQRLILKPRSMIFKIQVTTHDRQDLRKSF